MPRLSELTDYDPMGSFTGEQPTAAPVEAPSPLSNNVDKILNSIFRPDDKRLQLWPERLVRAGATAAGDVASGEVPQWAIDPKSGDVHTSPEMIEKAQEISALAGTGGLGSGGGSLNATPSLRPALKHNGKLYKGKPGMEHQDIIPDSLYNDFQKKAMSGQDLAEYNFGFVNDKGHFLNREDALKYGIDNGLIDPQAGKYGALTSTLFSDSSKPGTAIEAMKPTFYSALEHNVGQISQGKMNGEAWLGTLANKPGVKPEELQWTGLADFLNANKGKPVTKAQIEEHLASNKVELKEVNKGGEATKEQAFALAKEHGWKSWGDIDPATQAKYMEIASREAGSDPTKYSSYQLPGGENYREKLLTLPSKNMPFEQWLGDKNLNLKDLSPVERVKLNSEYQQATGAFKNEAYKSSHWDEPNIIAHVRMNDRTIDGKKTLHLEEIQSDWHQAGREKGYRPEQEKKMADLIKQRDDLQKEASVLSTRDDRYKEIYKELPTLQTKINEIGSGGVGVPDAPFKKNWSELALKRMLREASENGYDRLSWTAGEHHPTNPKNLKQTGPDADKADKGMQGFYNDIIPKVVEKLGKEHGVKVKTSEVETNPKGWHITPPSETVSGKWMVKSSDYNSKGWHFDTKAEAEANLAQNMAGEKGKKKIYYIDIPQSLKDTATQKGFPLFSKGGYMLQPVDFDPFAGKTELKT
jgi:hypothetical protein